MTVVKVHRGACGFVTRVKAYKEDLGRVRFEVESECEAVENLGLILERLGPRVIPDMVSTRLSQNRVFEAASETVLTLRVRLR